MKSAPFNTWVAWLNGSSVAVCDSMEKAESRAMEIFKSPDFQQWGMQHGKCELKITKGARQTVIKSVVLW